MNRNHMGLRILCATIFLGISFFVMLSIYKLSSENGYQSNMRSEIVTEKIKEDVNLLNQTKQGLKLSEKIKYYVITHSPYGSDWNANIRKLAHFSIYFAMATCIYITLAILGVNKFFRFILVIGFCLCFAFADEYYQQFSGRTSSMSDVYLDTFGALIATCFWTFISICCSCIRTFVNHIYKDQT